MSAAGYGATAAPRGRRYGGAFLLLLTALGIAAALGLPRRQADEAAEAPPAWLLPYDDAYIFIRFAQQTARGRPYQWTDGVYSSGASSFLYPWLLVPGQWLADDLAGWSRWSSFVGLLGLWLLGLAARRLLGQADLPAPWPLVGGVVLVLSGPIALSSLGGMETALACAALLTACQLWTRCTVRTTSPRMVAALLVLIAFLPWLRPEMAFLTGLACLAILTGRLPTVGRLWGPALLLPGLAMAALHLGLSGETSPAGAIAKSLLASPYLDLSSFLWEYGERARTVLLPVYLGLRPTLLPPWVGPLALPTAVLVLASAWAPGQRLGSRLLGERAPVLEALRPLALAWLVLVALAPLSGFLHWQHMRHHQPGLACASLLAVAGAGLLATAFLQRLQGRRPALSLRHWAWLGLLLPLSLLPAVPRWSFDHFRAAFDLHHSNGPAATWLREHAHDQVLLLNDAGLHALAHDGPAIDLIGLGTPAMARPFRHGPGAVAESLARQRPLPTLAAVNLHILRLPLLGPPLIPLRTLRGRPPEERLVLATVQGERLAHTALQTHGVDLAYLDDESRAGLRWSVPPWSHQASFALALEGPSGMVEIHGCRPLRASLGLDLPPDADWVRIRAAAQPGHDGRLQITAAGTAAILALPGDGEQWQELAVEIGNADRGLELVAVDGSVPCLESIAFGRPPGAMP